MNHQYMQSQSDYWGQPQQQSLSSSQYGWQYSSSGSEYAQPRYMSAQSQVPTDETHAQQYHYTSTQSQAQQPSAQTQAQQPSAQTQAQQPSAQTQAQQYHYTATQSQAQQYQYMSTQPQAQQSSYMTVQTQQQHPYMSTQPQVQQPRLMSSQGHPRYSSSQLHAQPGYYTSSQPQTQPHRYTASQPQQSYMITEPQPQSCKSQHTLPPPKPQEVFIKPKVHEVFKAVLPPVDRNTQTIVITAETESQTDVAFPCQPLFYDERTPADYGILYDLKDGHRK